MKNFRVTCPDGFTKVFAAMSKDEAVDAAMMDEEMKKHETENHPELAGKTPEELRGMMESMVTEEAAQSAM